MTIDELVEALLSAPDAQARDVLMNEQRDFLRLETVYALKERADRLERDDPRQMLRIGLVAEEAAEYLSNDEARALALWVQANAHNHLSELELAVRCYERAAVLFNQAGKPLDAARTAIGHMGTLMKMGQIDRAYMLAGLAREVFVDHGDVRYQATTDMELGSLYYYKGEYALALDSYKQATEAFQSLDDNLYVAVSQINQASMLMLLDVFLMAERLYEQARPVFAAKGLRSLAATTDHGLAILQSGRGNYTESFRTFERARDVFSSLSDQGNLAQTDLEESDLYLSLNLPDEALRLAQQAERAFAETGMIFELGRARTNHAVALARLGQGERADLLLEEAGGMFANQGNETWTAHTRLQRAEIMARQGYGRQAIQFANEAASQYEKLGSMTKQVYARIIIANAWADGKEWQQALQELAKARHGLGDLAAPWLEQRIEACLGRVYEGMGERVRAIEHYQTAAGQIEQMAATLTAEEHRTAYVTDKLAPYEALVALYAPDDPAEAFQWAERAKSRALVDMLAAGIRPRLKPDDGVSADPIKRLQEVREELNWLYTRLTRGTTDDQPGIPAAGPNIWVKIQELEREATSLWRELQGRHAEELSLIRVAPLALADVQSQLPDGTVLVEYFVARGQVLAFAISHHEIHAFQGLGALVDILSLMENLNFQFSKFQYGSTYYERHRLALVAATQNILTQIGQKLILPLWDKLSSNDAIIIVPHGPLHALPFQALRMNDRYLIETHAISYAPSASVLKFCWDKLVSAAPSQLKGKPLLIGIPDERATHIKDEIQALTHLFPDAEIMLGQQAKYESVRMLSPECGILHLAAHGLFRPDAPLLSSIRLADRWMAVQDIYDLDLRAASLVTLSACETGLGHDAGGDDLVGLVRGFLYAGASSLIVSLWTVDDESMTTLVVDFYTHWLSGKPKAWALRQAQLGLLKKYEHPFYWAPLVLVGNQN